MDFMSAHLIEDILISYHTFPTSHPLQLHHVIQACLSPSLPIPMLFMTVRLISPSDRHRHIHPHHHPPTTTHPISTPVSVTHTQTSLNHYSLDYPNPHNPYLISSSNLTHKSGFPTTTQCVAKPQNQTPSIGKSPSRQFKLQLTPPKPTNNTSHNKFALSWLTCVCVCVGVRGGGGGGWAI